MFRRRSISRLLLRIGPAHLGRARFLLRRLAALRFAFEVIPALFTVSLAGATFIWWREGMPGGLAWLRLILDPAMASILFVVSAVLAPGMFAGKRVQFPLPLTLPAVYLGLLVGVKLLTEGSRTGITKFADAARLDGYWLHPSFVLLVASLQVLVLAAMALRVGKRRP